MPAYTKIWIHFVWSTKHRCAIITKDLKYKLFNHIRKNANKKGIYIDHINGTEDHIHLLISLKGEQCPSKVVFFIKGESSHWVNSNKLTRKKFEWQDEYFALSVSESVVPIVRKYIRNQERHHKTKKIKQEYEIPANKFLLYKYPSFKK